VYTRLTESSLGHYASRRSLRRKRRFERCGPPDLVSERLLYSSKQEVAT
jgi:hypothetical protein